MHHELVAPVRAVINPSALIAIKQVPARPVHQLVRLMAPLMQPQPQGASVQPPKPLAHDADFFA
jgi:hypothetical protein